MPDKCNKENCELEKYCEFDYCVLHCEKHDYQTDSSSGLLRDFYDKLLDYLIEKLYSEIDNERFPKEHLRKVFLGERSLDVPPEVQLNFINLEHVIRGSHFLCGDISFPERQYGRSDDYFKFLKMLKSIHFDKTKFYFEDISDLRSCAMFFQNCDFYSEWKIENISLLDDPGYALYQHCRFHNKVSATIGDFEKEKKIKIPLFYDCEYFEEIAFKGITFESPIFNNPNEIQLEIKKMELDACIINNKFILNKCKIGKFRLKDTLFNSKFEFKENSVEIFNIYNCNFENVADYFKSKFKKFGVIRSIYRDFVGFEKCIFGNVENLSDQNSRSVFIYTTFKSFINLRETEFLTGLDLRNINPSQQPNFLGSAIEPRHTDRETFRIIKNSFDAVGNHIEANRFYSLEMEAYKKELNKKFYYKANARVQEFKNKHTYLSKLLPTLFLIFIISCISRIFNLDYWVFKISDLSSRFSRNWLLPLIWFVIISLFFFKFEKDIKITIDISSFNFDLWKANAQDFLKYINLFETKPDGEYNVFLWIPHRVISLYLVYQFIIAARRQTKR